MGCRAKTTHIFKLPLGLVGHMQADMHTFVENEWSCKKFQHRASSRWPLPSYSDL